ncbi:molecular chaperone GrpE [Corynebacterium sp. HMSC035E02]|uniref:molecular chaperone GrpE n=1 Tax=Corynebacterium sp. HMSC035E02 TaxID=1715114 RepID=UPI0008A9B02C|nr:molecular chaperone GrpE [Corynebacterium sp. HMSC035E02]OHO51059.1 molecular chaperone GrpE [Corynebacterium sp. HMSC035E02]
MMGQELFEHPQRQYSTYGITPLKELSAHVGPVEDLEELTEEQATALEAALEQHPEGALTFDDASQLWIIGAEEDIERMFQGREDFVEALNNNEDPGV